MREDRNVLDLMTADYTFLNERLAKHYGVPDIYGSHFRRVTLADDARKGLLGKGAILMVTSHADRTSPVVRGKWVLDNLLNAPPPPMPNNVPPLNESAMRDGKVLTMRERMEEHRKNPVCAGCHKIMDPIGLSMENFDAVGAWRTRDGGTLGSPINASGELLDGTKVDGVVTLRQALLRQPEIFVGTVTEKLMTYALGRGLAYYDMPAVRAHRARRGAATDYRFSSIVLGIVNSTPFQKRDQGDPGHRESGGPDRRTANVSIVETRLSRTKGARDHVHHQDVVAPADVPARHGRHAGAAAARIDGAGADGHGQDGRGANPQRAVRRDLRAARRAARLLDAEDRRRRTSSSRRF